MFEIIKIAWPSVFYINEQSAKQKFHGMSNL